MLFVVHWSCFFGLNQDRSSMLILVVFFNVVFFFAYFSPRAYIFYIILFIKFILHFYIHKQMTMGYNEKVFKIITGNVLPAATTVVVVVFIQLFHLFWNTQMFFFLLFFFFFCLIGKYCGYPHIYNIIGIKLIFQLLINNNQSLNFYFIFILFFTTICLF